MYFQTGQYDQPMLKPNANVNPENKRGRLGRTAASGGRSPGLTRTARAVDINKMQNHVLIDWY